MRIICKDLHYHDGDCISDMFAYDPNWDRKKIIDNALGHFSMIGPHNFTKWGNIESRGGSSFRYKTNTVVVKLDYDNGIGFATLLVSYDLSGDVFEWIEV